MAIFLITHLHLVGGHDNNSLTELFPPINNDSIKKFEFIALKFYDGHFDTPKRVYPNERERIKKEYINELIKKKDEYKKISQIRR